MPILKVNHYQSVWTNQDLNEKDFPDKAKIELVKGNGGPQVRFEEEKMEQRSRYVQRRSLSPNPPRRGTEIPGWYRQMYSEMGNPQSIAPMLIKNNRISSGATNNYSDMRSCDHTDRLCGSPYRPNTSNSYETESSRSSTPGRDGFASPLRINSNEKIVETGGVIDEEQIAERQEYYPYRDAQHGKPLPGENGFMVDSSSRKLFHKQGYQSNGDSLSPNSESLMQTRYSVKSTSKDENNFQSSQIPSQSFSPSTMNLNRRSTSVPSSGDSMRKESTVYETCADFQLTPEYFSQLRHIKVTSIPIPMIPPKFGTLTQGGRWPNEAQAPIDVGPPCQLCKKPITESRFVNHDKVTYHCWHFTCSHCFKTLEDDDFRVDRNDKPYCHNCFKRQYP